MSAQILHVLLDNSIRLRPVCELDDRAVTVVLDVEIVLVTSSLTR